MINIKMSELCKEISIELDCFELSPFIKPEGYICINCPLHYFVWREAEIFMMARKLFNIDKNDLMLLLYNCNNYYRRKN